MASDIETWRLWNEHEQASEFPGARWTVPTEVEVHEGWLVWDEHAVGSTEVEDFPPSAGWSFLRLADLEARRLDSEVLALAKKWGPLRLCEAHDLPSTHARPALHSSFFTDAVVEGCRVAESADGRWSEPVSVWKQLAQTCAALLLARAELSEGEAPSRANLEEIARVLPSGLVPSALGRRGVSRRDPDARLVEDLTGLVGVIGPVTVFASLDSKVSVAVVLRHLIAVGDVRPTVQVIDGEFTLSHSVDSYFGAMAMWLASELHRARPLVLCRFCGQWYRRGRKDVWRCDAEECRRALKAENKRRERDRKRASDDTE